MPVSEQTARKAVQRWHLQGRLIPSHGRNGCACRFWMMGLGLGYRQVYTCNLHRGEDTADA